MSVDFRRRAREAIADANLQWALDDNAERRRAARQAAFASLPDQGGAQASARAIRREVVTHIDHYLAEFIDRAAANGFRIHQADDAGQACRIVIDLCREHQAGLIAKSKSMMSEEIGLNEALEASGLRVVETDLGEYIVQLRGERPTHLISPAVHLRRQDVGRLFERDLGIDYTEDVAQLTSAARSKLREVFLNADIGISGVNFGVAETGTLCLLTNEGNGRMVTTLPQVHIALMGLERLVPNLNDLATMLQVLPRSATGQKLTAYVSLIRGPRGPDDPDGPEERHIILIDNGRSRVTGTRLEESLLCIRCGACLNACPVYREIGGHAYGSIYQGPIGSVLSPALFGLAEYGHLAKASTLCGACEEACPVGLRLPDLLLRLRDDHIRVVPQPAWMRLAMRAFTWVVVSPKRYRLAQAAAALAMRVAPRRARWIRWLPGPLHGWTASRHFPPFQPRTFRDRFATLEVSAPRPIDPRTESKEHVVEALPAATTGALMDQFEREVRALGGEVIRCAEEEGPARAMLSLQTLGVHSLITWAPEDPILNAICKACAQRGMAVSVPSLPVDRGGVRRTALERASQAEAGLTGATAALADTGTLVIPAGPGRSSIASLLPAAHLAVLRSRDIHASLESWLKAGGVASVLSAPAIALVSGPSRTADIEMTLTIGVHGPGKLIVLCLE